MPSWGNLNIPLPKPRPRLRLQLAPVAEPRLAMRPYIANEPALLASGVRFKKFGPQHPPPWRAHYPALAENFETAEQSLDELRRRQQLLARDGSRKAQEVLQALTIPTRSLPLATLANPLFYRWARIRFIAGCTAFFGVHPGPYRFVTLIPPGFFVKRGELDPVAYHARMWCGRLRTHLNKASSGIEGGWLIAGLHASFERSPCGEHTGYQFHFHCVIDEAMLPTIERLRDRRAFAATPWVDRPVQVDGVTGNLASLAGYLVKSYWSNRNSIGAVKKEDMVRNGSRLQGCTHTEALAWAHGQSFGHTVMCYRCDLPKYVRENVW